MKKYFCTLNSGGTILTRIEQVKNRIFSGIQPSGDITLGNYLGALKQFQQLQHPGEKCASTLYMIADLHSITSQGDGKSEIRKNVMKLTATYIASGIRFGKHHRCFLFTQSEIPQHSELMWILSCITSLGNVERMTQFKAKLQADSRESASLGLLSYPVLMAADVLLYKADAIPVGDDQFQHLELSREIAHKFNTKFKNVFVLPKPLILENAVVPRVMSLTEPTKKMSKSDENEKSRLHLTDSEKDIRRKIGGAVTDSFGPIREDVLTNEQRKGVLNLVTIYAALKGCSVEKSVAELEGLDMKTFKPLLSDFLISKICPIGKEIERLLKDETYLRSTLGEGKLEAQEVAQKTLEEVQRAVGMR